MSKSFRGIEKRKWAITIVIVMAALIASAAFSGFAAGWRLRGFRSAPPPKARLQAIMSQANSGAFDTVMLGDSIVEFANVGDLCGQTLNAGIAGSTTKAVAGFAPAVLAATKPKRVIISVGVNDANQDTPPKEFAAEYGLIVGAAERLGARVTTVEIAPVAHHVSGGASPSAWKRIPLLNAELQRYRPLPMYAALNGPDGFLPQETPDGVHLGPVAYGRWRRVLTQACSS